MPPHAISKYCSAAPGEQTHKDIQKESLFSSFCSFCGLPWPEGILIDDDEFTDSTPTSRTTANSSPAQIIPGFQAPIKRDRTTHLFKAKGALAIQKLRSESPVGPGKLSPKTGPYDYKGGLRIRLYPILSSGQRSSRGGFISKSAIQLGMYV